MKEIFIHAGYPKTATTSMQQCLYVNREFLIEKFKLLYPSIAVCHTNFIKLLFTQNEELFYQKGEIESRYDLKDKSSVIQSLNKNLVDEMQSKDWNKLVISSEYISSLKPEELNRLFSWCKKISSNIKILIYTRHPVAYSASATQQYLKGGTSLKQLYKSPPVPYFKRTITNLVNQVGSNNVQILSFESSISKFNHIIDSFFESIGLDLFAKDLPHKITTSNKSMSYTSALLWDTINELSRLEEGKLTLKKTGKVHSILNSIAGNKFRFPSEINQLIVQKTLGDCEWLLENYGIDYISSEDDVKLVDTNIEYDLDNVKNIGEVVYRLLLDNQRLLAFKQRTIKKPLNQ